MKKKLLFLIVFLAAALRLYKLGEVPPSLYWDEASLGYNAFAISQTLRDEHSVFLPLDAVAAFGDYKPVGYVYAAVPFVKILGLTETAVRLPSALAGTLLVLVTYFLTRELFSRNKISLLAALFVAVSPWSLTMSRAAFEANLATLFSALGIYLFIRGIRTKSLISFSARGGSAFGGEFCALSFALSLYTFNSHRIFAPVIFMILSLIFFKKIIKLWKIYLLSAIFYLLLLLPLIPHLLSPVGRLRFNEVTWLNNLDIVERSNKLIETHGGTLLTKLVYNRRIFYAGEFGRHYLDNFSPDFLFFKGDVNPRLSVRSFGEMYWWDAILVLAGIFFLLKARSKITLVIFLWLLAAPIPAALARETPHALRILPILPAPQILAAAGLVFLLKFFKNPRLVGGVVSIILLIQVFLYLKNYFLIYPAKYSNDWQYGYKQMVAEVGKVQNNYDRIKVTNRLGRPYIYFLFYNKYDPGQYWADSSVSRDQFGFWTVASVGKYLFSENPLIGMGKDLYVRTPADPLPQKHLVKTVTDLNNQPVFYLYD